MPDIALIDWLEIAGILAALVACLRLSLLARRVRKIDERHRMVHSPSEAETIAAWRKEMAACAPGSPRHTAYVNRLRSLGALEDE